jgi:two-component sensor histidine kinase
MGIHELCTNALKCGALSAAGHVDVTWCVDAVTNGRMLKVAWQEREGPRSSR